MRRREFMQKSGLAVAGVCVADSIFSKAYASTASSLSRARQAKMQVPIMQGVTSDTATQFNILTEMRKPIDIQILGPSGNRIPFSYEIHEPPKGISEFHVVKVFVEGLSLGLDYRLQVYDPASSQLRDERTFKTLDVFNRRKFRFSILSCADDKNIESSQKMWPALLRERPEMVFIIGDACYANHGDGTLENLWYLHCRAKKRLPYYYANHLIPTALMWDDHDMGVNNGNNSYKFKEDSLRIWDAFYGSKDIPGVYERGPATTSLFTGFGQNFFMMDGRYFLEPKNKNKAPWGDEGDEFLFPRISNTRFPSYLMNGILFFGAYILWSEAYEKNHANRFKETLREFSRIESPVVFVSGDVHFSQVTNLEKSVLGYETMELISSSMHSSTFPGMQFRSYTPRRMMSTSHHNFIILEADASQKGELALQLKSVGAGNKVYFRHSRTVRRY